MKIGCAERPLTQKVIGPWTQARPCGSSRAVSSAMPLMTATSSGAIRRSSENAPARATRRRAVAIPCARVSTQR